MSQIDKPAKMDQALYAILIALFKDEDELLEVVNALEAGRLRTVDRVSHMTLNDLIAAGVHRGYAVEIVKHFSKSTATATPAATTATAAPAAPQHFVLSQEKTPMTMKQGDLLTLFAGGDREAETVSAVRSRLPRVLVKISDLSNIDVEATIKWLNTPTAASATIGSTVRGEHVVKSIETLLQSNKVELDPTDGRTELDSGYNNTTEVNWSSVDRPTRAFIFFAVQSGLFRGTLPETNPIKILRDVEQAGNSLEKLATLGWRPVVNAWNVQRNEDDTLQTRMEQAVYTTRSALNGPGGRSGRPFSGSALEAERAPMVAPSNGSIDLSGPLAPAHEQALQEALLSAFTSRSSLEQMLYFGIGVRLNTITSESSLSQTAWELISWAGANNRTSELLEAATKARPGNPTLRAFAARCAAPVAPTLAWDNTLERKLRGVIAHQYPTEANMRRIAVDAQIPVSLVEFSGVAESMAFSLISQARRSSKLNELLAVVRHDYPDQVRSAGF